MYCNPNFKTKKALKEAVDKGQTVFAFSPGIFPCPKDGTISIEGPHYPEPHKWYASVIVENGRIIKVNK